MPEIRDDAEASGPEQRGAAVPVPDATPSAVPEGVFDTVGAVSARAH